MWLALRRDVTKRRETLQKDLIIKVEGIIQALPKRLRTRYAVEREHAHDLRRDREKTERSRLSQ